MKHNLLSVANGLHTPPCGTSRSKSSNFILTSLLVFLMTFMGSGNVWAGWRFQGQNGSNGGGVWDNGDNMTQVGSSDVWYYKISNLNADIQFKINNGNWDGEKQKYWSANHDDQNRGNVQLEDANDGDSDGKNRFKYSRSTNFNSNVARDLYIFVKGDANNPSVNDRVWAIATPVGENLLSSTTTYKMRGDLFLGSTANNGWADVDKAFVPTFERLANHVAERVVLLVPQPANSNTVTIRLEVKSDATKSISADSDGSNVTIVQDGTKVKITIPGTGNANTGVKKLTISHYASHKISAILSEATTDDEWYVYVDKYKKGKLSGGKLTISDLSAGDHSIFLAKSSDDNEISNPNSKGWSQCIGWLGGLHINKNASDVAWADQYQYTDGDRFSASSVKWPLKGQFDGRGQFHLNSTSNVRVKLTNGVISLDILDGSEPDEVTYTGKEYVFLSKTQKNSGDNNVFTFSDADAHLFVYFWNSETSANDWSDEAFFWDNGNNVLAAKAPAGTWTNCKIVRKDACCNGKDWNNVWNQTADLAVEPGKNYLQTGESSVWDVYTPPFYLTGSETLCGANWGYSGNGTENNGTVTRENIPAGTYQFKLNPTKDYSSNWGHQINYNHIASTGSNVVLSKEGDNNIQFTLSEASDVTIAYDGNGVTVNAAVPVTPAVTYTVTIHPNGGTAVSPLSVGEGNTISSIASTYGAGTAKWYTDEELTHEFVLGTSTVNSNMDLYAKWGVSGNYYIVGCLQTASDGGETGNWSNGLSRQLTYSGSQPGTCSFTFVAPAGKYPFEIIKNQSWSEKINGGSYGSMFDNSKSNVTLSESNGHLLFELSEPKQVTVSYDGKVWVNVTDYAFDNSKTWRIKTSWDTGEGEWHYNTVMTNNGTTNATAILRNVSGTKSFIISTKSNDGDAQAVIGNETFNALYVDMTSPSTGLTWNTSSVKRDGSDNFNSTTPQADGNYWRNCKFTLSQTSDIRITFDGGKIRCDILPKYTVTFNSNGGSAVAAQTLFEGLTVSEPGAPTKDGYTFVKWQKEGADYNFSSAVTGNIQLDAVWAYKAISGVSLNESEHTTWVGNSDFTLTPTLDPTDGITKSVVWSSNKESVATVSNGTVHAVAAGEARITITVTDQFDNVRTAYCDVTVAACQMTTDNLYSMTVTGYNSSTGGSATLNGLWNQAVDNTEPASMTITRLAFQKKDVGSVLYAYDDNGIVKVKEDASGNDVQWILIPVGSSTVTPSWNSGNACQLYYIKSMATGKYMYRGSTGVSTGNADWYYSVTNTNTTIDTENLDAYQWFFINENDNQRCIFVKSGIGSTKAHSYKLHTSNQYNDCTDTYAAKPYLPVGCTGDINAYAKSYKNTNDFSYDTYNNPNYVLSQVNSDYYRMNTDATVQANLADALVKGAIITVSLYADAATSVKLEKSDGTEVATIALNANATREYTYTVNTASALLGESAFVIKAADNHAAISSITVSRLHAVSPSTPDFTWDDDLSAGITQSTLAGNIVHTASSTESLGAIFYTSSNPSVASVAADGTVTPIMAGTTTITALIEEAECYAERAITYIITLTEPTLAELIDADNGTGITLTHNYAEDVVIDKAVTINGGGYSIGNLTVENAGDLTLGSALTVNDFTICAKAGNTSTPAESGQVRSANNLTVGGNAYFLYTVDPSGQVHYGWYDFTVPFPVNVMTGIAGIQNSVLNEDFVNERDYAIMEFLGDKQAEGQYPYKKFRSVMQPNKLYSITLDDDYNYNTVRFQKTNDGALVASNSVTLNAYAGIGTYDNWNGVGNGTLHHADAGVSAEFIQVYQSGDKIFLAVEKANYSLITGSAFLVQETGIMTLNQAEGSHPLLAPSRETPVQPAVIQIAPEGKPFSDQLFISADEMAGSVYTQGVDLAKAGEFGKATVPQIGTNAYNTLLCVHAAQLINEKAQYDLSLYAPVNGTYTLTANRIPEDKTLYLTFNGRAIWNLSMAETYALDLNKGITTEYGLLLVEIHNAPTDIESIQPSAISTQKVLRNGILYILRNGEVFDAQGARVQ